MTSRASTDDRLRHRIAVALTSCVGCAVLAWLRWGDDEPAPVARQPAREVEVPVERVEVSAAIAPEIARLDMAGPYRERLERASAADADVDPVAEFGALVGDSTCPGDVRAAALAELIARGAGDRRARAYLLTYLEAGGEVHRADSFACVLRHGDPGEVDAGLALLHTERDPGTVVVAARALAENVDPAAAQRALSLHWRHPDAEIRVRLRALRIGR
ncbi:MAG: hypothetical protein IPM29_31060 [Planctomycetes bacterium]|nr:hypothetical protein [Planctomycetota bacterium]